MNVLINITWQGQSGNYLVNMDAGSDGGRLLLEAFQQAEDLPRLAAPPEDVPELDEMGVPREEPHDGQRPRGGRGRGV